MLINQLPKVFLCSFWLIINSRLWHLIRIAHIYLWKLWNWNYGWSLSCFRLSRPARMKTIETMTGPILRITTAAHPQGNKPSITEIPFTITDTKQSPTRHKTVEIVWNFYGTNWNADACDWCSQNWGMILNTETESSYVAKMYAAGQGWGILQLINDLYFGHPGNFVELIRFTYSTKLLGACACWSKNIIWFNLIMHTPVFS